MEREREREREGESSCVARLIISEKRGQIPHLDPVKTVLLLNDKVKVKK